MTASFPDRPVLVPDPQEEAPAAADLLAVFEQAPLGIAVVADDGRITRSNRALARLLGAAPEELVGRTLFSYTDPEDLPEALVRCARVQAGNEDPVGFECRLRARGRVVWASVSGSRLEGGSVVLHVQDVGERKAREADLRLRALHDSLTLLPNRALLLERCEDALEHGRRAGLPVSLLFLDLDGFKSVNDCHGHRQGDRLLQQLAQRIQDVLRPGHSAARLGGDEFVVLCPATDGPHADAVADRVRQVASRPFHLGDVQVRLSAAVGRATWPPGDTSPGRAALALLAQADDAMYRVKRRRRASA